MSEIARSVEQLMRSGERGELEAIWSLIQARGDAAGWALSAAQLERYARALAPLVAGLTHGEQLQVIENYHRDHAEYELLMSPALPSSEEAWAALAQRVRGFLLGGNRGWSPDTSVGVDDLQQIALEELARALPSYRYRSRLASWALGVTAKAVLRHRRDASAQKRAVRPISVEGLEERQHPLAWHLEEIAESRELFAHVDALLVRHPDTRLREIFHLWHVQDQSIAEIGARLRLSRSYAYTLFRELLRLLQSDPQLRRWVVEWGDRVGE